MGLLARRQSDFELHVAAHEIHRQGNQCHPFGRGLAEKFGDLTFMSEKFADTLGLVAVGTGSLCVVCDVHVVEIKAHVPRFDTGKAFRQRDFAVADALDLTALKDDAHLQLFVDVVVVERLAIGNPRTECLGFILLLRHGGDCRRVGDACDWVHSVSMQLGKKPLHPHLTIRPNLFRWLEESPPHHAFRARTRRDAKLWQPGARKAFLKCLGDAPPPSASPLQVHVLETKKLRGYTRTLLTLDTARHLKAVCWLCVPDGISASRGRHAAMIATPGHGIGAKDLVALDATGKARQEGVGYQKDYALQAVRLGYPTLVIEPMGFGERRDADHMSGKTSESPCQAASVVAMMLGTTLARIRINDLQRGVDYLETLPFIDPKRIGLMGISGGGQMTLWTSAIETRIRVAIVSGYLNTFRDSVMAMFHCICNFVPGLARELDMADLAALIAPRPILVESGSTDPIFPIAATRSAVRRVREIYSVFNAEDHVEADLFEGDHQWSGVKVEAFLKKWL